MKDIGQAPQIIDDESQLVVLDDPERNYLTAENGVKIFYLVQQKAP